MRSVIIFPFLLAAALPALAEPPAEEPEGELSTATLAMTGPVEGDPHAGHQSWIAEIPAIQIEQDPTLLPPAAGALFIPALTESSLEPQCVVTQDGELIATSDPGKKIILPPGTYRVLIGNGAPEDVLEFEADVMEGEITIIPVEWSGLVVEVVNERGTSFRGAYELITMPAKDYTGFGLGAVRQEGERLKTWLLRPGNYMLLAAGESYQARRNFFTFRLEPGELVQLTVVMDELNGDLLGAGEIPGGTEIADGWNVNWTVGGHAQLSDLKNVAGKTDGLNFAASAFSETEVHFGQFGHDFFLRLNLEAGGSADVPDRALVPDVNEADLETSYTYFLLSWLGPSVLFSADTRLLPSVLDFDDRTDILRLNAEGDEIGRDTGVLDVETARPFSPVNLEFGAGLRLNISPGPWFNLTSFIGPGGRQLFALEAFDEERNDPTTPELEIQHIRNATQFGTKASLVGQLNATRFLLLRADADAFFPFDSEDAHKLDFRGTVTLRLSSFASLNYTARITDDVKVAAETQIDQRVLLRFSYKLF